MKEKRPSASRAWQHIELVILKKCNLQKSHNRKAYVLQDSNDTIVNWFSGLTLWRFLKTLLDKSGLIIWVKSNNVFKTCV